jgi:hypothetical protein
LLPLLAALASAPSASALSAPHIYWTDRSADTIGVANADGTSVHDNFITGANIPEGLAVDGQHIYWINTGSGTIGRANLDGTGIKQNFITGASFPQGLAVDDAHIYWTNVDIGTIGIANLDGTGVNQNFITGASSPNGLAVDSQHIYWNNSANGTIGRANLDGSSVNQSFVTGDAPAEGLAVDSEHIYWARSGTIGEADLDGTDANNDFIAGTGDASDLALDGQRIYWSNFSSSKIGAADLGGPLVNSGLVAVPNSGHPLGVAVSVPIAQIASPPAFPATPQGTVSQAETITVANSGQANLSIEGISLGGADPGDFVVSSSACLSAVPPGASCQITVNFAPQTQDARSATLQISTNDFANSPAVVSLSGTGSPPAQGPGAGTGAGDGASTPNGSQEPTSRIALVSCQPAVRHRRKILACNDRVVSGRVAFANGPHATIARGGTIYARGAAAKLGHGALQLVLSELRPLRRGRYTLTIRGHKTAITF